MRTGTLVKFSLMIWDRRFYDSEKRFRNINSRVREKKKKETFKASNTHECVKSSKIYILLYDNQKPGCAKDLPYFVRLRGVEEPSLSLESFDFGSVSFIVRGAIKVLIKYADLECAARGWWEERILVTGIGREISYSINYLVMSCSQLAN